MIMKTDITGFDFRTVFLAEGPDSCFVLHGHFGLLMFASFHLLHLISLI